MLHLHTRIGSFSPDKTRKAGHFKKTIMNIKSIILNKKSPLFFAFLFICFNKFIIILPSIYFGKIIDSISIENYDIGIYLLIILLSSITLILTTPYIVKYITSVIQKIIYQISLLFSKILFQKSYRFFDQLNIGTLIKQTERGVLAYEKLFTFILEIVIPNMISIVIITIYLIYISNYIIILLLALSTITTVTIVSCLIKARRRYIHDVNDAEDKSSHHFATLFLAGKTIKTLNSFNHSSKKLKESYALYAKSSINLAFFSNLLSSSQSFLTTIFSFIILYFGIYLTQHTNILTIGTLVTIFSLTGIFMTNLITLTNSYKEFDQFLLDKQKIDRLLELPNIRENNTNIFNIKEPDLVILPFEYQLDKNRFLMNKTRITIPFKSKLAIIGETGEGKTTLSKIIAGIIDKPDLIRLNDIDLHSLSIEELSSLVGYSFQFPDFLDKEFNSSILLDFFKASQEELLSKLNILNLPDELKEKALFNSSVEVNGLSGGEKKRLDIVRMSFDKNSIIIFDEPTSAIDDNVSMEIWKFIFNSFINKTIICITHDLSCIDNFDYVISIKNNEILFSNKRPI